MQENVATPIRTTLNSNITPRSGSRKARAETESPTSVVIPIGTPTASRPQSSTGKSDSRSRDVHFANGFNSRSNASGRTSRSESMISDSHEPSYASRPALLERNNSSYSSNGVTSPKGPAMFFHASDIQATVSSKQPKDTSTSQPKLHGWVNPNEGGTSGRTSALSNNSIRDDQSAKFFYANDPVLSKSPPPPPPPPRLSNGTSTNRPPLQTIYSAQAPNSPQRAPSPLKEEVTPPLPRKPSISKASPRRHTRLVSVGGSEIKALEATKTDLSRRSSLNSRTGARTSTSRARSSSVQSMGGSPRRQDSALHVETSPSELTKRASIVTANGMLPHSVNPPTSSFTQDYTGPLSPGLPQSPTKPQSKLDQMNELAANARRERKVLDLEISNSSLLAINRTLEREMRKQTAELRRYRRLSRSGRLSVAPTSKSQRRSKLSDSPSATDSDEDLSVSDSDDDQDGEGDHSAKSSASNRSDSPSARAARTRFRDPERLPLDLSAHRLLLLESQKMNQAIKRCLGHSDALIAAGKLALDEHAQPLEPETLGPKVLTPDEYDDDTFIRGQGLLSPSLGAGNSSMNPWERSFAQIGGLDGGLQTPDYTRWGSSNTAEPELPNRQREFDTAEDVSKGSLAERSAWTGRAQEQVEEEDSTTDSTNRTPSPPSSPTLHPVTSADEQEQQDHSFQASLDGLDSSSPPPSSPSPTPSSSSQEIAPQEDQQQQQQQQPPQPSLTDSRPPSPTKLPPTANAAANTPGNRSSIQNFGTYLGLQSLSIFGSSGGGGDD